MPNSAPFDRVGGAAAGVGETDDLGLEACACSRKEEKSAVLIGLDAAEHLAAIAVTTAEVSRSSAWPKA
jgi:hypothetical protein